MVFNWLFDSSNEHSEEENNSNHQEKLIVSDRPKYLSQSPTQEQFKKTDSESKIDLKTIDLHSNKVNSLPPVNLPLTANDLITTINQEAYQIMQDGLNKIRQSLKADRVLVYGFNPDGSGKVLAESVDSRWSRMGSGFDQDYFIKENNCKSYYVVNDISTKGFARCFLEALEAMEAKAYISIPIQHNNELLGFLSAYQNSGPRDWQEAEVQIMLNCATQFRLPLQKTAFIRHSQFREQQREKAIKRERGLAQMLEQIRNAKEEEKIFQIATQEGRKFLDVDRLAIYRFEPDWSGKFIAESVAAGWTKLIDTMLVVQDTYLQETQGGRYKHGECFVVDDIYLVGHQPCHIQLLEQFEARAYMIAPIFSANKKLWGLIAAYQNTGVRKWQADEAESLRQLGLQVGIGMTNISSLREIENQVKEQEKIAQQERAIARLTQKIQQSQELRDIFRTATNEVRQLLECDRVIVYQFKEDWSGEVLAESMSSGWVSVMQLQETDEELYSTEMNASSTCTLKYLEATSALDNDTYLKLNQGGEYTRGKKFQIVNDVYGANFSPCYLQSLEKYQAKAYMIVPIFQENKLWGLFAAYQNSGSREWQSKELNLLLKIAPQLGIAIRQQEYINQLQAEAKRAKALAEQEKAFSKLTERIIKAEDMAQILKTTTQEVRQLLQADRLAIYRFNEDWSGEFIAESVASGWSKLMDSIPILKDTFLEENQGGRYKHGECLAVNDIYRIGHQACHIELLEQFEARAYLIAPIFVGDAVTNKKLWGLLGIYQNSGPREWEDVEVKLAAQIGEQLGIAIQQKEYSEQIQTKNQELARRSERENGIIQFSSRLMTRFAGLMQKNNKPQAIMEFATNELRRVLKVDRVTIYRFASDWSGKFVVESVGAGWTKILDTELAEVKDSYIQENQGGRYLRGESLQVNDIYQTQEHDFPLALLETWTTKAYLFTPIFKGEQLWGLLGIYQNDRPRQWDSSEQAILEQVATNIGVTLQVGEYFDQLRSQEEQLSELAEQERQKRQSLEQGALRVLQALEPSFRGDLTVRAPLSEDEIGTIADGYNTTIQSMRELVRNVQVTASRVSETSAHNSQSVTQLSAQADTQVEQLQEALAQLQLMVSCTDEVANYAQKVEQTVEEANRTVKSGDSLMEKTVDEILAIRQTVSDTAKKIKRLGETFQKITKVVSLIENFATQTNLLALNAAIEATRAGEYGKGFAVVADEVRSLAYQSANATTEISRLVDEIQSGTREVTVAMEIGISQVVSGTELVRETQQSLSEVVSATSDIKQLVQAINQATANQSQQSEILTKVMADVSGIAHQTSKNAAEMAESFEELEDTSRELQTSVRKFKVD
jgi:methyl-accepting chemotaxis protein PixJ